MKTLVSATTALVLLTTACAQNPQTGQYQPNNKAYGAGIGAAAGAAIGSLTGSGSTDRRQKATWGALAGALAGTAVGHYMDQQEAQLRQQMPADVDVQRQGDEILLTMPNSITFAFDSAAVQPTFFPTLTNVANTLNQFPKTVVNIIGHTDSTGTDQYNMSLSQRRAQAVSSFLVQQNVNAMRMTTAGMGESQPIASNDSEQGRAQNRRVEIRLTPVTQ